MGVIGQLFDCSDLSRDPFNAVLYTVSGDCERWAQSVFRSISIRSSRVDYH